MSLTASRDQELARCAEDAEYFIRTYVKIYDAEAQDWIDFDLWDEQARLLATLSLHQLHIWLKARQLGLTWLVLAYVLWLVVFHPIQTVLIWSLRDADVKALLTDRLKAMHERLPGWMQQAVTEDNEHEWTLANGSQVKAFPTTAGDSYTATFAFVDEADLIPHLSKLLRRAKPTIDMGGRMVLLSRADKEKPESHFKKTYRAGKLGENRYHAEFLPWDVHPGRDTAWYEQQCRDALATDGTLDNVHEQYPATDAQALAAKTLDKRFAPGWFDETYVEEAPLADDELPADAPSIPGLKIWRLPEGGRRYSIGIDPAEGNPNSNDSALEIVDSETLEQVAELSGKFQPQVIAAHAVVLADFYNGATIMPERNNHGHTVILWIADNSAYTVAVGLDKKAGWHTTTRGKAIMYDAVADVLKNAETRIHSFKLLTQLQSIEGNSLNAPEGLMDDCADGYALAVVGAQQKPPQSAARAQATGLRRSRDSRPGRARP